MEELRNLLRLYPLGENERYCMYTHLPDGWPYGYLGDYPDIDAVVNEYAKLLRKRSVLGIWISKESYDGTVDITIFRRERRRIC